MRTFLVSVFLFIALVLKYAAVFSEESQIDFRPSINTPYHSVYTHLYFLQADSYNKSYASLPFLHSGLDSLEAVELAVMLKQAWDARGYYVDVDKLPKDRNYQDSITGLSVVVPAPQTPDIFLVRNETGQWVYGEESFDAIKSFHNSVFPFGADGFTTWLPYAESFQLWGLFAWQYLGVLLVIVLAMLLYKLFAFVFNRLLYKGANQLGYDALVRPYLLPVAKPLSWFVVFLMVMALFPLLQLPLKVNMYLSYIFRAILPLFAVLVFYKLVDVLGLYLERLAGDTKTSLDNHVVPMIKKILKVFVVVVGALFILQNLDVNITALLAGLSIGGLALALAAQDTLKNLFGSLMIFVDKPFQVGHWVSGPDIDGTVEEVGFRSTRIRTFRNSLTYVPNGKLADMTLDNHGLREFRRFFTHISLTYDTPPDLIEVYVQGLRRIVEKHPKTRKDFYLVEFNEMADFSLNIMFYIFFAVPTWAEELRARHEILIEVVRLADKLNVRFAFPTQSLHVENFPDKSSLTPEYAFNKKQFEQIMEDYFKDKQV